MPFLCLCCLLLLFVCFTSNAVAATCTISYKFVSDPEEELIDIDADTKQRIIETYKLPQEWSKSKGKIKIGNILKDESFQDGEVLWEFKYASPDFKVITSDTEITLYWTSGKKEEKKCKVSFQYDFDSDWREFPETVHDSIKNQFPIQQEMEILQDDVLDLAKINDSCFGNGRFVDQENDGVWTTEGYKNKLGTDRVIVKDDVTFTAVWTFKGNEYDVRYLAVSADETKPFPETLTERAQPAKKQKVEKGDWVRAYAPAELQIEDGTGKWVFTGYTRSVILGQSGDNCFIGKWKYLEKTPQVTYTFISDTIGADLPQEILQYLPLDTKEYSEGEIVKAIEPAEKRFQSKHDKDYSSVNNWWKFVGYDADEKTMADGGVSFTGKWVRITEASTRMLIYTSTDEDEPIPDELAARASDDLESFPESGTPELPDDRKVFENAVSTWTFDRFVHQKSGKNLAAEMVVGYWKFTEKSREISFSAQSLTEGRELPETIGNYLPEKETVGARKTNLVPSEPTTKELRVTGAAWVYRGYKKTDIQPGSTPVDFISEWEYVPDEPVSAEICGKVSLSGKKISEESFEFILVKDNMILEQVNSREDGSFSFSPLQFSADDLERMPENGFEYQVMEVDGGETKDGTALDGTVRRVTVLLGEKDSKLTVQVIGTPEFINTYSAEAMVTVNAKVEFSGLEFADGVLRTVCMRLFSFELYEKDGGNWTLIGSADCDERGRITLQIPMDHLSTGLHCYQIVQADQADNRILIDKRQLYFNLNVTDGGDGTLKVDPVYVGQNLASVQNVPVTLPELVFVNRVESEMLSVEIDETVSDRNGWQLFANGMPVEVEESLLSQILTETENEIRLRGLPSYDTDGNRILWSVQLATKTEVQILQLDGNVKDSYYAEDGEVIRSTKTAVVQTENDFSADLILSGTDTLPEIQLQLLKNGKECDHAIRVEKIDDTNYRLTAENLGNGQYSARLEPISGYQIRYTDADGKTGSSAGDGGKIQLMKIPNTGDTESLLLFATVGVAALCLAACCARRKESTQG